MPSPAVQSIIEQIRGLTPEEQVKLAEVLDRLTWARRWLQICERIESRRCGADDVSDDEIDELVRTVRKEKPLSGRSSTHRC